ncbi:thiamine pyrophosphate-dependent dehydrogenase E1 component subunit alpha [Actinospica robiniae]|uniref:thiamine pyrophosphate-dependent dehydrogenase E1 component subunit alpha n=1 Tax=Actinospica robiniae TaxID=304901 RepID=UPI0003FE5EC3|nr:thiamine pyrophosphate-dependent dehydrogenase E1 component subunit alpha [Actinospica robiniae]
MISPSASAEAPAPAGLSPPAAADLDSLLMIRHFERSLLELFAQGRLNGTTHTCLGQEYIPVALYPLLDEGDFVFSNHRGHGHYLARFDDPAGLLAEIMGRAGAVCNGVGGSQHIFRDRYLSTGVQGQSLPVAAGVALHLKHAEPGRIAVAHIGDGTWGEGAVYEALNMASLWRLPLLVVVENNGIAQSTPTAAEMAGTIAARAAAFGIRHHRTDSIDVAALRGELAQAVAGVRERQEPCILEFVTQRVGPHSKGDDTRDANELRRAREGDWYELYRLAFGSVFADADERQRRRVDAVIADVAARPPSEWTTSDGMRA